MRTKIIIAGVRDGQVCNNRIDTWLDWMMRALGHQDWNYDMVEIVSGGASGIDDCGERYALNRLGRKATIFPADWKKHGKAAGPKRNGEMALYADAALVFMNKEPSPGSSNMAAWMLLLEKPVKVLII